MRRFSKMSWFSLVGINVPRVVTCRYICVTPAKYQENVEDSKLEYREVTKNRSESVPVETSIKYLKSPAYFQTYGEKPVWVPYRRNHKGTFPPTMTRKTCIRNGVISTGNPCPICRDEYLVLNEQNTELLKQFISPQTGAILGYSITGLCRKKHQELEVKIKRAYDMGLITYDVPFRKYDYLEYQQTQQ
ncbi:small ribosomal subunit protein mS40 [Cylas formicarius]|uniref:small ribosomal subunit protein mS40 n=1 Tax=Cylas formicarius TaxID=197179 RepID=UPI002958AF61|nr:small ribosomal subunit protein mS40 [Cylas formicarius]